VRRTAFHRLSRSAGPALLAVLVFNSAQPVFADGTVFDLRHVGPALPVGPPAAGPAGGGPPASFPIDRAVAAPSLDGSPAFLPGDRPAAAPSVDGAVAALPVNVPASASADLAGPAAAPAVDGAVAALPGNAPVAPSANAAGLVGSPVAGPAPTEAALRTAFPDRPLRRLDPAAFNAYVDAHAGQGRLLTGPELAVALADRDAPNAAPATHFRPASAPACDTLPDPARARCLDSVSAARTRPQGNTQDTSGPRALREYRERQKDSASVFGEGVRGEPDRESRDASAADEEEAKGWFVNLMADIHDGGGKGLGGDDWAAVIYVVVGVVVVGAFLIYGIQTLAELAVNDGHDPLFQEAGVRLSYSGKTWRDGAGGDLYRDAYLAGLRYAIGFDRPGMDVGLSLEGGYIDIRLTPENGSFGETGFDFNGAYVVAGPLLRFGSFDPFCFSLEFLNGTSTHESIGWISKSRMALQARMGGHAAVGAHLGAVFYDLEFLDGLAWRRGDFNRDLSLVGGVDFGWLF
jgi:hypothetical protein